MSQIVRENIKIEVDGEVQTDRNWFQEYPVPTHSLMYEWMDLVQDYNEGDWIYHDVDLKWEHEDEESETHTLRYFHAAKEE